MENNTKNNLDNIESSHSWYSLRVISGKEKAVEQNIIYESREKSVDQSSLKTDKILTFLLIILVFVIWYLFS